MSAAAPRRDFAVIIKKIGFDASDVFDPARIEKKDTRTTRPVCLGPSAEPRRL
jgi:hypothetical protein